MSVRILAFAGSTRAGSFNKKLCAAGAGELQRAGAEVTLIDLRDHPLPMYDGDLESSGGLPPGAVELKKLFLAHDGLLIASPEYNSAISGVLKNSIDWVSRQGPGEPSLACFKGKVAAIVSASTGVLGGLRGLVMLRSILGNIGVLVLPEQLTLPKADGAFDPTGILKEQIHQERLRAIAGRLVDVTRRLQS